MSPLQWLVESKSIYVQLYFCFAMHVQYIQQGLHWDAFCTMCIGASTGGGHCREGLGEGGGVAGKDCNPLTPESIWHLTSPYSITAESNIKVMELIANQRRFSHYWNPSTLFMIKQGRKNYSLWLFTFIFFCAKWKIKKFVFNVFPFRVCLNLVLL